MARRKLDTVGLICGRNRCGNHAGPQHYGGQTLSVVPDPAGLIVERTDVDGDWEVFEAEPVFEGMRAFPERYHS